MMQTVDSFVDPLVLIGAVIAIAVVEWPLLAWLQARGRGPRLSDLAPALAAGLCLMLAVLAALSGAAVQWLALCLTGAGAAHAVDLRRRWRVSESGESSADATRRRSTRTPAQPHRARFASRRRP